MIILTFIETSYCQKGDKYDERKTKKRRKLTKKEKQQLAKREERIFAWKEGQDENIANLIEQETESRNPRVNQKVLIFKLLGLSNDLIALVGSKRSGRLKGKHLTNLCRNGTFTAEMM